MNSRNTVLFAAKTLILGLLISCIISALARIPFDPALIVAFVLSVFSIIYVIASSFKDIREDDPHKH